MNKWMSLAGSMVLIIFIGILSIPWTGYGAQDGKTIMEARCGECHGLDRVVKASKDRAGWETTVGRMMNKGVTLSPEEKAALIDYLVSK